MFKLAAKQRPQRRAQSLLYRSQKQHPKQAFLDRAWRQLTAWSSRPFRRALGQYQQQVRQILRHDAELKGLTEQQLTEQITALKQALRQQGLTDQLTIDSFALIREVAGRTLGMWHFDSQLLGGLAILHGNIAQMQTGEGKTLTATLPVATAAMAGISTHMVTVNDYLTERDAELMRPVYQRLGLTLGVIIQGQQVPERQAAYRCDIVYCTNNELAFDFLKDQVQLSNHNQPLLLNALNAFENPQLANHANVSSQLMQRGLHFAVVDEADSVLMDEASTPLIISGEQQAQAEQQQLYQQAYQLCQRLEQEVHFKLDRLARQLELTAAGQEFILSLTADLGGLWRGRVRKLELIKQALIAQYLFEKDKQYLVDEVDGQLKVIIIDEHTGRRMPDRTWEQGLHQLIEIKESCPLSPPRTTLASISFQNFFRYYHHLSGMTGTAEQVTDELWQIYGLPVVTIPTHKPPKRQFQGVHLSEDEAQKWQQVVTRIVKLVAESSRPILIGTQSLKDSETLSEQLAAQQIPHQLLNARQDKTEAEIVAQAGLAGKVTIATSMAGRGTDIRLDPQMERLGGLHVLITGLHDSARVDRQLEGRCARQGDQGSVEYFLSLNETVLSKGQRRFAQLLWQLPRPLATVLIFKLFRRAQASKEKQQANIRYQLLRQDQQKQELLSFTEQQF